MEWATPQLLIEQVVHLYLCVQPLHLDDFLWFLSESWMSEVLVTWTRGSCSLNTILFRVFPVRAPSAIDFAVAPCSAVACARSVSDPTEDTPPFQMFSPCDGSTVCLPFALSKRKSRIKLEHGRGADCDRTSPLRLVCRISLQWHM